jgi:hypothetical protein
MTSSHFYAVPKINSFTRSCGLRYLSMPSSRNEEAKTTSTPGSQAPSAYHARRARNSSSRHQKSFQQRHPLAAASNFFPLPLKAYITWPRSTSAALLMWYPKPVLPLPAARRAESVASTLLLPQPHTPPLPDPPPTNPGGARQARTAGPTKRHPSIAGKRPLLGGGGVPTYGRTDVVVNLGLGIQSLWCKTARIEEFRLVVGQGCLARGFVVL